MPKYTAYNTYDTVLTVLSVWCSPYSFLLVLLANTYVYSYFIVVRQIRLSGATRSPPIQIGGTKRVATHTALVWPNSGPHTCTIYDMIYDFCRQAKYSFLKTSNTIFLNIFLTNQPKFNLADMHLNGLHDWFCYLNLESLIIFVTYELKNCSAAWVTRQCISRNPVQITLCGTFDSLSNKSDSLVVFCLNTKDLTWCSA